MASELSDKLLAEILELDAEMTVTMHIPHRPVLGRGVLLTDYGIGAFG
jgi:hypothetical protein